MGVEYLNNKIFEEIIARFMRAKKRIKKDKVEYDDAAQEMMNAFYLLADNIIRAFNFKLIDRDDAIQEGVMVCFEKVGRFDPTYVGKNGQKAKAFNYLTTCLLNQLRQLYRTSKNYNELKKKYLTHIEKLSENDGFPSKNYKK